MWCWVASTPVLCANPGGPQRQHSLTYRGGHPWQTAMEAAPRPECAPWKTAPSEGCESLSRARLAQGGSVDARGDLRQPWDTEMPG